MLLMIAEKRGARNENLESGWIFERGFLGILLTAGDELLAFKFLEIGKGFLESNKKHT